MSEQRLNSRICGRDIVTEFQEVAKLARSKNKDFLWHQEDLFDHNFTSKQKEIIFKILNEIIENTKWKGMDWNRIFK